MYLHVKVSATQEIGERGSNTSRLVVCDQMRSEGHEEPGFALTALFTVMRSSVNYLKLERVCFMSRSKPLNDTHRHTHTLTLPLLWRPNRKQNQTCKHLLHNIFCRCLKWRSAVCIVFRGGGGGIIFPHEHTHYNSTASILDLVWPLKLNLHDSRADVWFESRVWLHMMCSIVASGAAESSNSN